MSDVPQKPFTAELDKLIGKQIVVDTDSSYIIIGHLESAGADYLRLSNVDVHDTVDSESTKELYTHETKKLGTLRSNRKMTYVRMARVLTICLLDDVISY